MIDRLERLLNLVIALRETRRPLPASEIRERVAGYGQPDAEAFRRMFERDKADLRALGVPVQAGPLDRWDDRIGYRIDPSAYDLPPVRLEPGELAALALALTATGLAEEAGAGLAKLEVDAALDGEDPVQAAGPVRPGGRSAVEVELEAPNRLELMEAQLTRTPVRFTYRPLGRAAAVRTVDPHALVHRSGFWYLVGHDHDRRARRAFRLDRIEGQVAAAGPPGAFAPVADVGVEDVVPSLPPEGPARAEVAVTAAIAWQVARRALGGSRTPSAPADPAARATPPAPVPDLTAAPTWQEREGGGPGARAVFTVPVGDPERFVRWALEYGPDLVVLGPPELRDDVLSRLHAAAALGAPADPGSPR